MVAGVNLRVDVEEVEHDPRDVGSQELAHHREVDPQVARGEGGEGHLAADHMTVVDHVDRVIHHLLHRQDVILVRGVSLHGSGRRRRRKRFLGAVLHAYAHEVVFLLAVDDLDVQVSCRGGQIHLRDAGLGVRGGGGGVGRQGAGLVALGRVEEG